MTTFLVALAALIVGFFIYGQVVDKVFKPTNKPTPAITKRDGVDFEPLPPWKVFLIQLLNIAGLGPIFGALGGALWGPSVYLWIVFGTIFAGGVHDYISGLVSMREDGKSMPEIVGKYLGGAALTFMRVFLAGLMILIGAVFTVGPAGLLQMMTGFSLQTFVLLILAYYFLATLLPIDKIIGKLYPLFGICFIIMALGVMFGMFFGGSPMPEMTLENLHPNNLPIWPLMFVTVACGAVSGFHSTQSPIMARCLTNEHLARPIFYGAMVAEGIIALIWAAAGITFFHGTAGLNEVLSSNGAGAAVYQICQGFMGGGIGMALAMIGVVACPITSGDTALRSARLILSDWFKIPQDKLPKRLIFALPIILLAGWITQMDFNVIWRYFAWSNQTIATIVLWTGAVYLSRKMSGNEFLIALVPAIFMTAVTTTYILVAPEGFNLHSIFCTLAGILFAGIAIAQFKRTCKPNFKLRAKFN